MAKAEWTVELMRDFLAETADTAVVYILENDKDGKQTTKYYKQVTDETKVLWLMRTTGFTDEVKQELFSEYRRTVSDSLLTAHIGA
jgi:hypothetical protein